MKNFTVLGWCPSHLPEFMQKKKKDLNFTFKLLASYLKYQEIENIWSWREHKRVEYYIIPSGWYHLGNLGQQMNIHYTANDNRRNILKIVYNGWSLTNDNNNKQRAHVGTKLKTGMVDERWAIDRVGDVTPLNEVVDMVVTYLDYEYRQRMLSKGDRQVCSLVLESCPVSWSILKNFGHETSYIIAQEQLRLFSLSNSSSERSASLVIEPGNN